MHSNKLQNFVLACRLTWKHLVTGKTHLKKWWWTWQAILIPSDGKNVNEGLLLTYLLSSQWPVVTPILYRLGVATKKWKVKFHDTTTNLQWMDGDYGTFESSSKWLDGDKLEVFMIIFSLDIDYFAYLYHFESLLRKVRDGRQRIWLLKLKDACLVIRN